LLLSVLSWIKLELLGHLVDEKLFALGSILDPLIKSSIDLSIPIISDTAVDEFVLSTLVSLERLSTDLLLSVDESILVSMMVEVDLSESIVNLDEFLPVVVLLR
jgi:hypothetical protein